MYVAGRYEGKIIGLYFRLSEDDLVCGINDVRYYCRFFLLRLAHRLK